MKNAEEFRRELGEVDESFERCVRQTLMDLEREEEKPVKKKISLGLVLALAVMLLTVTAMAAGQWGIMSFLEEQGVTQEDGVLLTEIPRQVSRSDGPVKVTIEEALCDGERLYLAVMAKPMKEKTLVVPYVGNIADKGTMGVMNNLAYDMELSVQEYAQEQGYDHVVTLYVMEQLVRTTANQSEDKFTGLEYAFYDHMEDGTLRMILQYGYDVDEDYIYPERMDMVSLSFVPWEHSAANQWQRTHNSSKGVNVVADLEFYTSKETRRSVVEDAHDIVGYRGAIEYVAFTSYDDQEAGVSILMDMTKLDSDKYWMTGPEYVLVDDAGNRLCSVKLSYGYDVVSESGNPQLYHGTIPVEYMPEDKVTIRLENENNYNIVYDEYTYTLE